MYTVSGIWVDPLAMEAHKIRVWDIAWPLSQAHRYAGHSILPWPVLSHLGLVHSLALAHHHEEGIELTPMKSMALLLHDAGEAYLSDIPRPLKKRPEFQFYLEAENELLDRLFAHFGLGDYKTWADFISIYDDQALHVESTLLWRDVWADEHKVSATYPLSAYPKTLNRVEPVQFVQFLRDRMIAAGLFDSAIHRDLFQFPERLRGYTQAPDEDEAPIQAGPPQVVGEEGETFRENVDNDPILNER